MYDLETDIENVIKLFEDRKNSNLDLTRKPLGGYLYGSTTMAFNDFRDGYVAGLNASTAVKELREAEERILELEAMNEAFTKDPLQIILDKLNKL